MQATNHLILRITLAKKENFSVLLLNRISSHIEPILRRNQNGFRRGQSTLPQILALQRMIEVIRLSKKKALMLIADFSKAFDSVNSTVMLHIRKESQTWSFKQHYVRKSINACSHFRRSYKKLFQQAYFKETLLHHFFIFVTALRESIFVGIKFSGCHKFWPNPQRLVPRNSKSARFAKINLRENISFFRACVESILRYRSRT